MKKLYRSSRDARICGLCAGIGEYLDKDPNVIRLLALIVVAALQIVPGVILYFVLSMFIPREPEPPFNGGYNEQN